MGFVVAGHRGAPLLQPENTLVSFVEALRLGVNEVELDLRLSRDGHIVVIHDATLDRTTDGTGPVADTDLAALKVLDAGAGQGIPTFEEVLDGIDARLQAEIKDPAVIEPLVTLLQPRPQEWGRCSLTSFSAEVVAALAARLPFIEVGLISRDPSGELLAEAQAMGASRVLVSHAMLDQHLVRTAHMHGLRVDVWPVESAEDVQRAYDLGADGFTVDDPTLLRRSGWELCEDQLVPASALVSSEPVPPESQHLRAFQQKGDPPMTSAISDPAAERQHPAPSHRILHISDTHFVQDDALLYGAVDCDDHLKRLLGGLRRSGILPDALVFTGDLTDAGHAEAYRRLRAIVEPACAEFGAEPVWAMGNHDSRPEFRQALMGGEGSWESVDYVRVVDGLRIIVLDSTVPGHHHGEISREQYEWLAAELAAPAEHGSLLALHHPPVPSPLDVLELVELKDQDRLAEALAGSDVRGILAGHLHYSTTSTIPGGIPVSVAAATCYTQDLHVQPGRTRGLDGAQGCNLVEVYPDRVVHSVIPLDTHPVVTEGDREGLLRYKEQSLKDHQDRLSGQHG